MVVNVYKEENLRIFLLSGASRLWQKFYIGEVLVVTTKTESERQAYGPPSMSRERTPERTDHSRTRPSGIRTLLKYLSFKGWVVTE